MLIFVLLVFSVALFVDGATDCANCVSGAVASKTLSLRTSIFLNSLLSFLGCLIFCLFFPAVAENTASAVSIPEGYTAAAVISALLSVTLWSALAWFLGLPTSEGHGLMAATAGAALSLGGEISVGPMLFLFLSIFPVAMVGAVLSLISKRALKNVKEQTCKIPVLISALLSSFFHGAQDGQKFVALAISASLINERNKTWIVLLFSFFMATGAHFGKRIIKKMGNEMSKADKRAALASDMGSVAALTLFTLLGIPASTTHIKITSLAFSSNIFKNHSQRDIFILTVVSWIATFPICLFLGFFISKLSFVMFL